MEHTNQKQTYLPELPLEIWSKIFYYVPITHRYKQLMLAHNTIALSKKHVQLLAHEWYDITQNHLKNIPDDGSNEVNSAQKKYLQNALLFNKRWNNNNQAQFSKAVEKLVQSKIDNGDFVTVKKFFISLQDFQSNIGYRIKRLPTITHMTDNQLKLFLIAFNHANLSTLTAIDNQLPIEQVNGIGACNPRLSILPRWRSLGPRSMGCFSGIRKLQYLF